MRILLLALFLGGCAAFPQPTTFNQRVAYVDGFAKALGTTCLDLSKRERISVNRLIRCTSVVSQTGVMIDTARTLGPASGEERIAAARELLLELEEDLKEQETK